MPRGKPVEYRYFIASGGEFQVRHNRSHPSSHQRCYLTPPCHQRFEKFDENRKLIPRGRKCDVDDILDEVWLHHESPCVVGTDPDVLFAASPVITLLPRILVMEVAQCHPSAPVQQDLAATPLAREASPTTCQTPQTWPTTATTWDPPTPSSLPATSCLSASASLAQGKPSTPPQPVGPSSTRNMGGVCARACQDLEVQVERRAPAVPEAPGPPQPTCDVGGHGGCECPGG